MVSPLILYHGARIATTEVRDALVQEMLVAAKLYLEKETPHWAFEIAPRYRRVVKPCEAKALRAH